MHRGTAGHLGITYIVIKETFLHQYLSDLTTDIILALTLVFFIITLIGFYLAKHALRQYMFDLGPSQVWIQKTAVFCCLTSNI